jgi:hypothetical protein
MVVMMRKVSMDLDAMHIFISYRGDVRGGHRMLRAAVFRAAEQHLQAGICSTMEGSLHRGEGADLAHTLLSTSICHAAPCVLFLVY